VQAPSRVVKACARRHNVAAPVVAGLVAATLAAAPALAYGEDAVFGARDKAEQITEGVKKDTKDAFKEAGSKAGQTFDSNPFDKAGKAVEGAAQKIGR
jgi:methylmalonyl-CoA mutase cobalamin-binding subunit